MADAGPPALTAPPVPPTLHAPAPLPPSMQPVQLPVPPNQPIPAQPIQHMPHLYQSHFKP